MSDLSDVSRGDDVPPGAQLAWRLRALIRSGRLPAGSKLPSIREVAPGAKVNVNTVRTVYRRLEVEGLAVTRRGSGTFVADHAAVSPALEQLAIETAESAAALGADLRELATTLYVASTTGSDPPPLGPIFDEGYEPSEEEARRARRALREQIARLETQLAAYPDTFAPGHPEVGRVVEPKVLDLAELETVRDQLVEKVGDARAGAEARGERQEAARLRLEQMAADPRAHRGEAVLNQDLGEPGCAKWEVTPRWGPVGALMDWWRVKISSGCP